jgi:hypothetical protein
MGPKICPSGPFIMKSGKKAQTIMAVEKNKARSTSPQARRMRSLSGNSEYSPELMWR